MAYVDLNSIQNPSAGATILSAWGDQARDNFEAIRNPFRCNVNNGFENVTDTTTWTVTFANEIYDTDGMFGAPSQIVTIQHDGLYDLRASVHWDANATGRRFLQVIKNGVTDLDNTDLEPSSVAPTDFQCIVPPVNLVAGDQLTLIVQQTSGITLQALVAFSALFICP